jgi:hypothetical protein
VRKIGRPSKPPVDHTFKCPKCGLFLRKGSLTPAGTQRWYCRGETKGKGYCYSTTSPESPDQLTQGGDRIKRKTPLFKRSLQGYKRFIVTAAQNATPVHAGFLRSIEQACEHLNAELIVIPIRYKNPTSRFTKSQKNEEVWAPELAGYLYNSRKPLNKNLILLGDIKTQPTAGDPLSGFEAITHGESGILGHTKMALRSIPTPSSRYPKLLATTGALTIPNYTDSKAGKLGAFHHTFGACLIERDGGTFQMRQINATKDGTFQDLGNIYSPDGILTNQHIEALITGDTHVDFIDPRVERATYSAKDSIVKVLRPRVLGFHDLLDGYSINHHHGNNPFIAIAKRKGNMRDARREAYDAIEFVRDRTGEGMLSVIISSNHDEFLGRWIRETDWRTDPLNAQFYLELALEMVKNTEFVKGYGAQYPNPFIMLARANLEGEQFKVLDPDESFMVKNIELGMHGDNGPNGARGSIRNLRRIGVRSILGHSHTPAISEGAYQVGTSTALKAEYTTGPSSWMNTHCVIYQTGKRSLIHIIDGDWRLG